MADLEATEARLWSILEPYRGRGLVDSTIYGVPSLTWPGAKGHEYFAALKRARSFVSLYIIAVDTYPEALEGTPPASSSVDPARRRSTFPRSTTRWRGTSKRC